jgi:hypothetical protein
LAKGTTAFCLVGSGVAINTRDVKRACVMYILEIILNILRAIF